jgi:hypothetical protein
MFHVEHLVILWLSRIKPTLKPPNPDAGVEPHPETALVLASESGDEAASSRLCEFLEE